MLSGGYNHYLVLPCPTRTYPEPTAPSTQPNVTSERDGSEETNEGKCLIGVLKEGGIPRWEEPRIAARVDDEHHLPNSTHLWWYQRFKLYPSRATHTLIQNGVIRPSKVLQPHQHRDQCGLYLLVVTPPFPLRSRCKMAQLGRSVTSLHLSLHAKPHQPATLISHK